MLIVRPLTHDRIEPIAAMLCTADLAELDAAGIEDAKAMLRDAVPWCRWADEALWDGLPVAVFGVRQHEDIGVPWMLTTTHMEAACRRSVALAARREVGRMRREFDTLMNLIHARNEPALRFVKALGFVVDPKPRGPRGEFLLFRWSRDV